MKALSKGRFNKEIAPDEVRAVLAAEVERVLSPVAKPLELAGTQRPHVILVVGVNGTGKTTTIGKMAKKFIAEGKSVTIAAGDTFRAAAIDQLKVWGERTGAEVIARNVGARVALGHLDEPRTDPDVRAPLPEPLVTGRPVLLRLGALVTVGRAPPVV